MLVNPKAVLLPMRERRLLGDRDQARRESPRRWGWRRTTRTPSRSPWARSSSRPRPCGPPDATCDGPSRTSPRRVENCNRGPCRRTRSATCTRSCSAKPMPHSCRCILPAPRASVRLAMRRAGPGPCPLSGAAELVLEPPLDESGGGGLRRAPRPAARAPVGPCRWERGSPGGLRRPHSSCHSAIPPRRRRGRARPRLAFVPPVPQADPVARITLAQPSSSQRRIAHRTNPGQPQRRGGVTGTSVQIQ